MTLLGDTNDDYLGTSNGDLIYGGGGKDSIAGSSGNDYIDGGDGDDRLTAGRGDDTVYGGAGNDRIYGDAGLQILDGGAGNDWIQSGNRDSTLEGGEGNDTLILNLSKGATFVVSGGEGADLFQLESVAADRAGVVILTDFQLGIDSFTVDGLAGAAVLNAGQTYALWDDGGFEVTLATGDRIRFEGERLQDFQTAFGLGGADLVTGSNGYDRIFVGDGMNVVNAGEGNDSVIGGNHADWFEGGAGNDTMNGLRGNDTIYGGEGDDVIHDSRGINHFYGGAGNDRITSGSDGSFLDGGEGADELRIGCERGGGHEATGGAGDDVFDFRNATTGRAFSAVLTDFDAMEDSLMIGGIDGFLWIAQQGYGLDEDEDGTTVSVGATEIVFAGMTAEEMDALIPDLIIH